MLWPRWIPTSWLWRASISSDFKTKPMGMCTNTQGPGASEWTHKNKTKIWFIELRNANWKHTQLSKNWSMSLRDSEVRNSETCSSEESHPQNTRSCLKTGIISKVSHHQDCPSLHILLRIMVYADSITTQLHPFTTTPHFAHDDNHSKHCHSTTGLVSLSHTHEHSGLARLPQGKKATTLLFLAGPQI